MVKHGAYNFCGIFFEILQNIFWKPMRIGIFNALVEVALNGFVACVILFFEIIRMLQKMSVEGFKRFVNAYVIWHTDKGEKPADKQ